MVDKKQFTTVDEYIKTFPEDIQSVLEKLRKTIQNVMPEAEQTMSYGIPTFRLNGKYVIYFSGWKHHVSLYPIPKGNDALQKEIAPFVAGKGTLRFPLDSPIPYDLVEKIAAQHLKEKLDFYP